MNKSIFLVIALLGCSHLCSAQSQSIPRDARYPAHWWTPVSEVGKPSWEILPQEAGPNEVILSKRNELGLLSNFAATPFTYRGKRYASLEGFWQMMLYPEGPNDPRAKLPGIVWKYSREHVAQLTAFEAKSAGTLAEENMARMGIDWVTFENKRFKYRSLVAGEHYRLILAATWEKVRQNPEVKRVLLSTGDLILKPDHHGEPNAPPEWRYYELWMQIRKKLRRRSVRGEQGLLIDGLRPRTAALRLRSDRLRGRRLLSAAGYKKVMARAFLEETLTKVRLVRCHKVVQVDHQERTGTPTIDRRTR